MFLFIGPQGDDPLFLQLKQAQPSVLAPYVDAPGVGHEGRRVVEGQRLMQAASDVFLGWARGGPDGDQDFYVRQLRDMKGSAEIERMAPRELDVYARLCGATLARAHARSGQAPAIAGYLGKGDAFDRAVAALRLRLRRPDRARPPRAHRRDRRRAPRRQGGLTAFRSAQPCHASPTASPQRASGRSCATRWTRAFEARLVDTGLALASRLFVAVIPLALLVTSLLPAGDTFADRVVSGMQLEGEGREAAEQLFAAPDTVRAGMTLATVIVVAYSVVSCGGVLQRMYVAAWRLDGSVAGRFWIDIRARAIWAIGFILYIGATFAHPDATGEWWSTALRDVARPAVAVGFSAWTPYMLLSRRVSARQAAAHGVHRRRRTRRRAPPSHSSA